MDHFFSMAVRAAAAKARARAAKTNPTTGSDGSADSGKRQPKTAKGEDSRMDDPAIEEDAIADGSAPVPAGDPIPLT